MRLPSPLLSRRAFAGSIAGVAMGAAFPALAAADSAADYAEARKGFHTKLTRTGPAPQRGEPLQAPPGADLVPFQSGGRTLQAYLGGADAHTKRPAVLFLHGGFALGWGDWEWALTYLNEGCVVMMPAVRGENGQGGAYSFLYDEVDDVLAAADTLAAVPGVDPAQMFIVGHSIGGSLTILAAMASKRFRGAASFSGSPDQEKYLHLKPYLAPFDLKNHDEIRMRSPISFVQSFKCPFRLFHGSSEGFFAATSNDIAKRASGHGLDVQAVAIPGNHMSEVPGAMRASLDFFGRL